MTDGPTNKAILGEGVGLLLGSVHKWCHQFGGYVNPPLLPPPNVIYEQPLTIISDCPASEQLPNNKIDNGKRLFINDVVAGGRRGGLTYPPK